MKTNKTTVFVVSTYLNTDVDSLVVVGVYSTFHSAVRKATKYAGKELRWTENPWDADTVKSNTFSNETIYISSKKVKF